MSVDGGSVPSVSVDGGSVPLNSAVPDNRTLNPAMIPESRAINSRVLIPGWNPDVIVNELKDVKSVTGKGTELPFSLMPSRALSTAMLPSICAVEGSNSVKSNVVLNVHIALVFCQ